VLLVSSCANPLAEARLPNQPPPTSHPVAATGQPFATGSGFVVDATGHVVTSYHVVASCTRLWLRHGAARVQAQWLRRDRSFDLALLLSVGRIASASAVFRSQPPVQPGESVYVGGFPRDARARGALKLSAGRIAAFHGASNAWFRLSMAVDAGGSGGPILDTGGRVVGVASGSLREARSGAPNGK
jgi:S1-C subfamily serine protease